MKKYHSTLAVFSLMAIALLGGCGGGSGKSGDEGDTSLSGCEMVLSRNGTTALRLLFSGHNVDVVEMERLNQYHETYTYSFNSGDNTAVLNVISDESGEKSCSMEDVRLSFDDAGRTGGVVASGTFREIKPQRLPVSLAGWSFRVTRG